MRSASCSGVRPPLSPMIHSASASCERGANISQTTPVHARVTSRCQIPSACGTFVAAKTRASPRVPPRNLNGKEGVDGSSPSEGLKEKPVNGQLHNQRPP